VVESPGSWGSSDCWYEIVQGSELEQGDILRNYPVVMVYIARSANGKPDVFVEQRDVVVLTQTCDIPKESQASILVAQIVDYNALCRTSGPEFSGERYRNKLIENTVIEAYAKPLENMTKNWRPRRSAT
jgi:phosphoribosyl 1,2-cyclic phosphodiesterase